MNGGCFAKLGDLPCELIKTHILVIEEIIIIIIGVKFILHNYI